MTAPFRVDTDAAGGARTLNVVGELDQGTAPKLRGAIDDVLDHGSEPVIVNLSDCGFIDSTGLSLLVEAKRRLAEEERRLVVCCADQDVRRLLELTGIDRAVGLFETLDEAVASLGDGSRST